MCVPKSARAWQLVSSSPSSTRCATPSHGSSSLRPTPTLLGWATTSGQSGEQRTHAISCASSRLFPSLLAWQASPQAHREEKPRQQRPGPARLALQVLAPSHRPATAGRRAARQEWRQARGRQQRATIAREKVAGHAFGGGARGQGGCGRAQPLCAEQPEKGQVRTSAPPPPPPPPLTEAQAKRAGSHGAAATPEAWRWHGGGMAPASDAHAPPSPRWLCHSAGAGLAERLAMRQTDRRPTALPAACVGV